MFASSNSILLYNKSRQDDLESAFYLIIYLLNHNYLPWKDLCTYNTNITSQLLLRNNPQFTADFNDMLIDGKILIIVISNAFPIERLRDIFDYISKLGFA